MKRQESVQDNQPSGSSVIITEEKDLVLVEYTKGKIYFAIKDGDFLTYCQRPVGVIRDGHFTHAPQKLSFTVNEKDRQSFDEKYIICLMKGSLVGKCIKADQLSISIENQIKAIHKYIN
ncbi:uncharacterized protein LOC134280422 [Saccostrea cucullata]|uniref:uncharacterized protein LOC134280422 n=1 Tax=Saccostrea cuccullata TaxID=36930 RepID=UPI002ED5C4BE